MYLIRWVKLKHLNLKGLSFFNWVKISSPNLIKMTKILVGVTWLSPSNPHPRYDRFKIKGAPKHLFKECIDWVGSSCATINLNFFSIVLFVLFLFFSAKQGIDCTWLWVSRTNVHLYHGLDHPGHLSGHFSTCQGRHDDLH